MNRLIVIRVQTPEVCVEIDSVQMMIPVVAPVPPQVRHQHLMFVLVNEMAAPASTGSVRYAIPEQYVQSFLALVTREFATTNSALLLHQHRHRHQLPLMQLAVALPLQIHREHPIPVVAHVEVIQIVTLD